MSPVAGSSRALPCIDMPSVDPSANVNVMKPGELTAAAHVVDAREHLETDRLVVRLDVVR